MQLHHLFESSAARFPEKLALVADSRLTYAELDVAANRLAHALRAHGVERGDRVVVLLDNSSATVTSIYGILKAGAAMVVVNPATKPERVRFVLNNSRAKALITTSERVRTLQGGEALPALKTIVLAEAVADSGEAELAGPQRLRWNDVSAFPDTRPDLTASEQDLAALLYTSGSTGPPKGVMLSHANLLTATDSIVSYLENRPDDILLNVLPLSFGYGLTQILTAGKVGARVILHRNFAFPMKVIEALRVENVTGFALVPTIVAMLLQMDLRKWQFPALRYITNAAAGLPVEHIRRLREALPQTRIFSMYGQTECIRICYLPPQDLASKPDSVGIAIPRTEVFLAGENGKPLPNGSTGELVVRGRHVMQGYWERPEATARALRPGPNAGENVLYTGDLFRTDAEGYLYFVSRKDDIIKSRGEKVSPNEIEQTVYQLEGVREAVAIGVPDPILGEAVKLYVCPKQDVVLEPKPILAHCAKLLEDYKVPREVEICMELPKTLSGKLSRSVLRAEHAAKAADWLKALEIDPAKETERIGAWIREVVRGFHRKGAVIGLSGGIDSSVTAALCARALGPERVIGLLMPERDSSPETLGLSRSVAQAIGIQAIHEDITGVLDAFGCYRRRDDAIREVIPDYTAEWKSKIVLPNPEETAKLPVFSIVVQPPGGSERKERLTLSAYLGVVAATNFKQRTRKLLEYYYADRFNFVVAGTPNLLEYDQGFFVKNGDGAADLKPIAHLYKSQVYKLAEYLGIPEEVRRRPPTTDTYSLGQSQEEFYFSFSYPRMDALLYARDHGIPVTEVASALELTAEQVERAFRAIDAKRRASVYLGSEPLKFEP